MRNLVLGISSYYHDSAAALLEDGEIVAAAQEERFSRKKHDASFPCNSIKYVLSEAGIDISELSAIAFYDKPYIKFERLLETYHAFAPKGLRSFLLSIPVWIKEKLFMKRMLWAELKKISKSGTFVKPVLFFPEHHLSHAASAFYPSPYDEAAILTVDGVGEWATTTISYGAGRDITILKELSFPHSLGLLYSAFTYYCGFKVNSGEYKLMGLAPYGNINSNEFRTFKKNILDELVDIRNDGSFLLNMAYFEYAAGLKMCNEKKWETLFGVKKREAESELSQDYMNLALAIQEVTEEIMMKLVTTAKEMTKSKNIVMAGGVALNCVANGKILESSVFDNLWIQPAAGDAGGALGAAYAAYYIGMKKRIEKKVGSSDRIKGSYLGPSYSEKDIDLMLKRFGAPHQKYPDMDRLCYDVAKLIADGGVIGWFQGRMEWGPRALGNRSIVADPRNPTMQKKLNLKIKNREGFRPFAPSVLEEDIKDYFDLSVLSPYMLVVAPVQKQRRRKLPDAYAEMDAYERLYYLRSDIPAVTHVNFSARVQSVNKNTNQLYWKLINAFKQRTGIGLIVNTSFNVRGEPIVCTPEDAYRCFMRTEMDWLVINNCLIEKTARSKEDG